MKSQIKSPTPVSAPRLAKALAAHGIACHREGNIVHVQGVSRAEILLPASLPLEVKAVQQLLAFAAVHHPAGGHVCKACATPDFHPGSPVPVGSVLVTSHDFVVPQAVGTDINCGMRLHVLDLTLEQFLAKKPQLVELLKGDTADSGIDGRFVIFARWPWPSALGAFGLARCRARSFAHGNGVEGEARCRYCQHGAI